MIVATFRTEAMIRGNALFSLLPALVRESNASRYELRQLDHHDLQRWVRHRYGLDRDDEVRLTDYLQQHSEGVPLFARETMRTIEEERVLYRDGSDWQLGDLKDIQLSLLVQQVVEARLDRVSAETRELLAVAAIIGEDVPLDLWGQIAQVPDEAILEATEEAVNAWLIVATSDGARVRFQHGLFHQAIYEQILPPHRRNLHRQVAEFLVDQEPPEPERTAYHFQQIGDIRAIEWLQIAGSHAWQAWAWQEAAARYEAAIALLEHRTERNRDRGWLLLHLAECQRYSLPGEALKSIRQAETIARECGDQALDAMTRWVKGRIAVSTDEHGLPDLEAAVAVMNGLSDTEQERIRQRTGNLIVHAPAILSVWRAISGRYSGAIKAAATYLALPGDQRTPLIDAEALLARGIALGALGEPAASRTAFDATLEIYTSQEDHYSVAHTAYLYLLEEILPYETDNLTKRGEIATAGDQAWELATAQTINPSRIISPPVLFLDGRWDEVRDITARTLGLSSYVRLWTLPFGMMVARFQGDPKRVRALQQLGLPHEFSYREDRVWLSVILAQLHVVALLALDEGDLPQTDGWIRRYEQLLEVNGRVTGKTDGLLLRARYHRLNQDLEQAQAGAKQALALAGNPRQPLTLLTAHRILGEIHLQLDQPSRAEECLRQASVLARDCNVRHEQIAVLAGRADLAIASGEYQEAAGLIGRAREEARQLGATLLIDRLDLLQDKLEGASTATDNPAGLTGREVEVLVLIVEGHTDAEIAEMLHISARTVTNHVANILAKTGSRSRAAAAAFAVRSGLA